LVAPFIKYLRRYLVGNKEIKVKTKKPSKMYSEGSSVHALEDISLGHVKPILVME
jgi:hypothetical protein